jgi:hypothetical protein
MKIEAWIKIWHVINIRTLLITYNEIIVFVIIIVIKISLSFIASCLIAGRGMYQVAYKTLHIDTH